MPQKSQRSDLSSAETELIPFLPETSQLSLEVQKSLPELFLITSVLLHDAEVPRVQSHPLRTAFEHGVSRCPCSVQADNLDGNIQHVSQTRRTSLQCQGTSMKNAITGYYI
jgi:hypothetical protein